MLDKTFVSLHIPFLSLSFYILCLALVVFNTPGANANSVAYSPTQFFGSYIGGGTPGAYNHAAFELNDWITLNTQISAEEPGVIEEPVVTVPKKVLFLGRITDQLLAEECNFSNVPVIAKLDCCICTHFGIRRVSIPFVQIR